MRRPPVLGVLAAAAALVAVLALPSPAAACAVCYGAAESPMTEGMNNAILTLLGVIGGVQVGFVALFWNFRKRARRLDEERSRFRLLRGGR